jgi:hypothetical protein
VVVGGDFSNIVSPSIVCFIKFAERQLLVLMQSRRLHPPAGCSARAALGALGVVVLGFRVWGLGWCVDAQDGEHGVDGVHRSGTQDLAPPGRPPVGLRQLHHSGV